MVAYHLIGGGTDLPIDIGVSDARDQLRAMSELGTPMSLADALAGDNQERFPFVVSFDDAYANFAEVAWPLVESLSIPVILYVPVGFVEGDGGVPIRSISLPPCSWSVLRELAAHPLVTIGSHSYSHLDLRAMPRGDRREDLRRSRGILEDRLGCAVSDFCYPQARWSREAECDVAEIYDTAAIAGGLPNSRRTRPHRLGRVPIRRDSSTDASQIISCAIWLEEWVSDKFRRLTIGAR